VQPLVDHRRATAERNAAGILDAAERLLGRGAPLSVAAVAAEAGVSRPTVYAHYKTMGDIVEAAVERSVNASVAAFDAAEPGTGPADEALRRVVTASWGELARFDSLARGASEHLSPGALHRTHEPMMRPLRALVERGRREGAFRTDLPADWLVTMFFALMHGADEHARAHDVQRERVLALLIATMRDVFAGREAGAGSA
jgi:AcrR family transcriptional regulator